MAAPDPAIALFAPHPLLTVTIEAEGPARQSIHFHAGGQGVWVAAMARCMGARPIFCGLLGGESGELLRALLAQAVGTATHLVGTASASGCYVVDRRHGTRQLLAMTVSDPPGRHELDELCSLAISHAADCGWLVVTNPMPAEALPLEVYRDLVADARAAGARTLVDLSCPRLDSALEGEPDLVKINDWELAEFVRGPVSEPAQLLAAAQRLRDAGARRVVVTRGELPALVLDGEQTLELVPPRFEHGFREGCGDAMLGALAAAWAAHGDLPDALVQGAAAGAANFLRRGIGRASREVVQELSAKVTLGPWPDV
ncbi:MAG TPA: PfkB family carbohydrate kinase [Solirubrobacteraceae bacterium]|nr:PfkB family carbohydrate kinase [Solirubrobacteraceae bacterium]